MTHHETLQGLRDRVTLLDLEPGAASQNKQAYEILRQLQVIPKDELSGEDVELHNALSKKVREVMGV